MVKRLVIAATRLATLVALAMLWLPAQASELVAEPDRTRLYEGEVLTLTVKGSTSIDINLSNLFNFDISNLPSPDIEQVSPDFEILGQNQQYSIRTVNGEMVGEITWTYQLAPKSTGELTIPALTFQDSVSRPVTIEIVDGTPPDQANTDRDSFIELATDKAEVYVQEQLILTVRLFFRGNLIRGELSDPQHPDAIIEPLGKQREFARQRDGVRYRVVERRYALFPQKPRPLNLPPIRFEGQARDADGSLKFLRDSATLFEIPVNDVPAEFTGTTWLPATSFGLTESRMPPGLSLTTGDNLTRTLRLQAEGLPSEALPPLPESAPAGIRSYPEEPQRNSSSGPDGITSTLEQTRALVPVQAGKLTLPEIRIPWWDTESDSQKVATIPARTLTVAASEGKTAANAVPPDSGESVTPETSSTASDIKSPGQTGPAAGSSFWQWVSLGLAGIWVLTMLAWWRSRKLGKAESSHTVSGEEGSEPKAFRQLLDAAQTGYASTPGLFVQWANLHCPGYHFGSASDIFRTFPAPALEAELRTLQAHLFSKNQYDGMNSGEAWNGKNLVSELKQFREQLGKTPRSVAGLAPLYPDSLSV